MSDAKKHDVIMIGAGPTALAAAIYTTREDIDTLLFEKGVIGGLAAITDLVDNYPGFEKGIAGLELADKLRQQAERFGATIELGEVSSILNKGDYISLQTSSGEYQAKAVLIATGCDYKKAGVKGEKKYYGRGVHYCATCDGAFYRDKKLVVIGGGNSAAQESLFLTRFASHIDVLIRKDHWRASDVLVKEVERHEKISVHFNTVSQEIGGAGGSVTHVLVKDKYSDKQRRIDTDGVFVFVGLLPNTQFLKDSPIELDDTGFIKTGVDLQTNVSGVFAAGDVRSGATMQIASAVGEGATAALKIRHYLESLSRQ